MLSRLGSRKYVLVYMTTLLCVFGFAYVNTVHAEGVFESTVIGALIKFLYYIFQFMVKFMLMAMKVLDYMLKPELFKLLTAPAVANGWKLVRDFVNLFFVIMLLFVAICTILRIESYSAKRLLMKVLIAALLINFSKPITLFIIDISNLAMMFFANNILGLASGPTSFSGEMANLIGMQKVFDTVKSEDPGLSNASVIVISLIAGIVFMFIFGAMILVVAISLIYRIVAFIVLLILSPLAMVGAAMPGTPLHSSYTTWIRKMTGWAFYGPTLMFFLWLALQVMKDNVIQNMDVLAGGSEMIGSGSEIQTVVGGIMARVIPFAVAIYFLYYGYDMSKNLADQAGKSVGGLMGTGERHITKWAKRVGYTTGAIGAGGLGLAALGGAIGGAGATGSAALGGIGYWQSKKGSLTRDWAGAKAAGKKKKFKSWAEDKKYGGVFQDRKDKKEQWEASAAGGKHWNAYADKKAREKIRDWDTGAKPSDEDLKKMLDDKDPIKQRAAAMYKTKEGKVETEDEMKKVMDVAENDEKLKKELRDNAEKKNFDKVANYDWKYNQKETVDKWVSDKRKEYEADGAMFTPNMENSLRAQYNTKEAFREKVYVDKMSKMSLPDMKEQDVDFHNSQEFAKYMQQEIGAKGRFSANEVRKFMSNRLSGKQSAAWKEHRVKYNWDMDKED